MGQYVRIFGLSRRGQAVCSPFQIGPLTIPSSPWFSQSCHLVLFWAFPVPPGARLGCFLGVQVLALASSGLLVVFCGVSCVFLSVLEPSHGTSVIPQDLGFVLHASYAVDKAW